MLHCDLVAESAEDLQPCRNRLATLAENIRAWEEDISHPQIKSVSQDKIGICLLAVCILLIACSQSALALVC